MTQEVEGGTGGARKWGVEERQTEGESASQFNARSPGLHGACLENGSERREVGMGPVVRVTGGVGPVEQRMRERV